MAESGLMGAVSPFPTTCTPHPLLGALSSRRRLSGARLDRLMVRTARGDTSFPHPHNELNGSLYCSVTPKIYARKECGFSLSLWW